MNDSAPPIPEWPHPKLIHFARMREQYSSVVGPATRPTPGGSDALVASAPPAGAGSAAGFEATRRDGTEWSASHAYTPGVASSNVYGASMTGYGARAGAQHSRVQQPPPASPPEEHRTPPPPTERELVQRVAGGEVDALDQLLGRGLGYQVRRFPDEDALVVAVWSGNGPTYLLPREDDGSPDSSVTVTQKKEHELDRLFTFERGVRRQTCIRAAYFSGVLKWDDWQHQVDPEYLVRAGLEKGELRRKDG